MHRHDVLVVSSERVATGDLRRWLDVSGISSQTAGSVGQAVEFLQRCPPPQLIVVDTQLEDGTVLDFLTHLERGGSPAAVLVVEAPNTAEVAQEALRRGATGIVPQPGDGAAVHRAVVSALAQAKLAARCGIPEGGEPWSPFLGSSRAIQLLARDVARIATTDVAVLIQGETGTGKGVLARWIHDLSPRARGPFIDVNCPALSKDLFESEMCGFEKGAFTGATTLKVGLMEAANGGTMFLDEIGDLDAGAQPRLLKLIEEKRFRRLGSVREQRSDARFIAASNHDLHLLVRERRFRADLLFRVNTVTVVCPPLRDRAEDIPELAHTVLGSVGRQLRRPGLSLSPDVVEALRAYSWPGNIRELQHVIERAVLMSEGSVIGVDDLSLGAGRAPSAGSADVQDAVTLASLQIGHIQMVLDAEKWNVEKAARRLGMPRSTLYHKIKQHRLSSRAGDSYG
jgi:DNA-binding NtrC family response regulator